MKQPGSGPLRRDAILRRRCRQLEAETVSVQGVELSDAGHGLGAGGEETGSAGRRGGRADSLTGRIALNGSEQVREVAQALVGIVSWVEDGQRDPLAVRISQQGCV